MKAIGFMILKELILWGLEKFANSKRNNLTKGEVANIKNKIIQEFKK